MKLSCLLLLLTTACFGQATCSQSDVQTAVNAAADGAVINVPAGSCPWTGISWSNKNITLLGAGVGVTNITGGALLSVTADTKGAFRISGMTFNINNTTPNTFTFINNTATERKGWRFDHITINLNNGSGTGTLLWVQGLLWGLVDHVTFNTNGNPMQAVNNYAFVNCCETGSNTGATSWEVVAAGLGTDSAVYIESSTFNCSGATAQVATGDAQYGGREVWRFNTITQCLTMNHAAWDSVRGAVKLEAYNNTISGGTAGARPFLIRSGTALVFNNTITGAWSLGNTIQIDNVRDSTTGSACNDHTQCDGTQIYDQNLPGQTGYACEDQIGRNHGAWGSQTSFPMYAANNSSTIAINCTSPHVQANRDYYAQAAGVQTTSSAPFNGTSGTGWGTLANRPTTCTTGVGFWATDQGTWNQSGSGGQGLLYTCASTNTWSLAFTPLTFPNPLQGLAASSSASGGTSLSGRAKLQ